MSTYTVNGQEVSKEEALKVLNTNTVSADAEWKGDTLVITVRQIKTDKTNFLERKYGA